MVAGDWLLLYKFFGYLAFVLMLGSSEKFDFALWTVQVLYCMNFGKACFCCEILSCLDDFEYRRW